MCLESTHLCWKMYENLILGVRILKMSNIRYWLEWRMKQNIIKDILSEYLNKGLQLSNVLEDMERYYEELKTYWGNRNMGVPILTTKAEVEWIASPFVKNMPEHQDILTKIVHVGSSMYYENLMDCYVGLCLKPKVS